MTQILVITVYLVVLLTYCECYWSLVDVLGGGGEVVQEPAYQTKRDHYTEIKNKIHKDF